MLQSLVTEISDFSLIQIMEEKDGRFKRIWFFRVLY